MDQAALEQVLDKLARDVEASIHAFYRGDVRQHTQRVKTDTFVRDAKQSLNALLSSDGGGAAQASSLQPGVSSISADELSAAMRCVMGWQPMGPPNMASAESRCVAGAKEILPTWGEREKARQALKRAAG
jgi:hypothetical protein